MTYSRSLQTCRESPDFWEVSKVQLAFVTCALRTPWNASCLEDGGDGTLQIQFVLPGFDSSPDKTRRRGFRGGCNAAEKFIDQGGLVARVQVGSPPWVSLKKGRTWSLPTLELAR